MNARADSTHAPAEELTGGDSAIVPNATLVRHSGRTVSIPGTSNVRDLGGLPTVEGPTLRRGVLYRGESIARRGRAPVTEVFADEALSAFRALRLRTVVDLRTPAEAEASPSAWAEASGAEVVSIPVAEGAEGSDTNLMGLVKAGRIVRFGADDLGEMYVGALERRAREFAAVIRAVATPGRQPALVHCAAGKDRTGLAMALILATVGVPREEIVADYVLTGYNRPDRVQVYAPTLVSYGVDPEAVRAMFESPASAMHRALDHVEEQYGSVEGYLRDRGLMTDDTLAGLREALVGAAP